MNMNTFLSVLPVMAKGMAGVFIVTVVIITVIKLISKISENIKH